MDIYKYKYDKYKKKYINLKYGGNGGIIQIESNKCGTFGCFLNNFNNYADAINKNVDSIYLLGFTQDKDFKTFDDLRIKSIEDINTFLRSTISCKIMKPFLNKSNELDNRILESNIIEEVNAIDKLKNILGDDIAKYTTYGGTEAIYEIKLKENSIFKLKFKKDIFETNSIYIVIHNACFIDLNSYIIKEPIPIVYENFIRNINHTLHSLHRNNMYHGDIKEENIVICKRYANDIKLIDFGSGQRGYNYITGTGGYILPFLVYAQKISSDRANGEYINIFYQILLENNKRLHNYFINQINIWQSEFSGLIYTDLFNFGDQINEDTTSAINLIKSWLIKKGYVKISWQLYLQIKSDEFAMAVVIANMILYYRMFYKGDLEEYYKLVEDLLKPDLYYYNFKI